MVLRIRPILILRCSKWDIYHFPGFTQQQDFYKLGKRELILVSDKLFHLFQIVKKKKWSSYLKRWINFLTNEFWYKFWKGTCSFLFPALNMLMSLWSQDNGTYTFLAGLIWRSWSNFTVIMSDLYHSLRLAIDWCSEKVLSLYQRRYN